jgi:hypothetical protein
MVLWGPNDGPTVSYEEDARPLGRKRELGPIRPDAQRSEYDWQKGEGPSAPDSRNMATLGTSDPDERPFKLGWVRRGKPGAPASAMAREAKAFEERQAEEDRLVASCLRTAAQTRRDFISRNRDRTGVNPITGETYDEALALETEKAFVRGTRSLPERPSDVTAGEDRRSARSARRLPIRQDFMRREGAPADAPERARASDVFAPFERTKPLSANGEGGLDTRRPEQRRGKHVGRGGGIGPGMFPVEDSAGDGFFLPPGEGRRPTARDGKDSQSGLGSGLVPREHCSVPATASFLRGAAMFDFSRSGFRNGGGWK